MTDKPPQTTVEVTHAGVTYRMQLNQFTARDEREIWRATGVPSIPRLLTMGMPVWGVVALLWRWRVTQLDETDLTYEALEAQFTYDNVQVDLDPDGSGSPEATQAPEA